MVSIAEMRIEFLTAADNLLRFICAGTYKDLADTLDAYDSCLARAFAPEVL